MAIQFEILQLKLCNFLSKSKIFERIIQHEIFDDSSY